MSQELINHNLDLRSLQQAGYQIAIESKYLVVRNVPYVSEAKRVEYGVLASALDVVHGIAGRPTNHAVYFCGSVPCDEHGKKLTNTIASQGKWPCGNDLEAHFQLSRMPKDENGKSRKYVDHFEKMTVYYDFLCEHAKRLNPSIAGIPVVNETKLVDVPDSVLKYPDTNLARQGIEELSAKLAVQKIAVVGVGGTGAYILDQLAKTEVQEIHLFDDDIFELHNAFRCAGAASIEDIEKRQKKVDYLASTYSRMHGGIVPHPYRIDQSNVNELGSMKFVFVGVESHVLRTVVHHYLESNGIPFINVGMGLYLHNQQIGGQLQVTMRSGASQASDGEREPLHGTTGNVPSDIDEDEVYGLNIQVADLNALNAMLAIIKWKQHCGFYKRGNESPDNIYRLEGNCIINVKPTA